MGIIYYDDKNNLKIFDHKNKQTLNLPSFKHCCLGSRNNDDSLYSYIELTLENDTEIIWNLSLNKRIIGPESYDRIYQTNYPYIIYENKKESSRVLWNAETDSKVELPKGYRLHPRRYFSNFDDIKYISLQKDDERKLYNLNTLEFEDVEITVDHNKYRLYKCGNDFYYNFFNQNDEWELHNLSKKCSITLDTKNAKCDDLRKVANFGEKTIAFFLESDFNFKLFQIVNESEAVAIFQDLRIVHFDEEYIYFLNPDNQRIHVLNMNQEYLF